ncbi:UDP-N-acetylmuramate--L-alanine ligase [Desulfovibrio ferrophilus]|uniref:UDP-N-acetylmuramate--L-alanine ligase n=1 Tax=Desulfovibrio ferrophilus TaxID=241368 RepID=A0A2Z6AZC8_9BACT|nr:UDP-N-acetylmuramate--L-alanine ligase [Desulfovibrio ferrophilus]BBD08543.1 UDP-N-acetylmuramate--L-alanine ligase [Desulfovibrio ferrophilus]
MRNKIKKIHMVGIGGSGMNGIAEVLLNLGYDVAGSDLASSSVTERLVELGATVHKGHLAENLGAADVLVKSTAVGEDNPEVAQARKMGIPVIPRAEMLAELMRLRTGIAVAGTHGKTTTTSFLASIFTAAKLDPTVIIGGRLNTFGTNALLGEGEYLIAEADESDGSFLCLMPIITVVTNVDMDHMDFYPNLDAIENSFVEFMNSVPFHGLNVVCLDDPGVRKILPRINRPVMTYGLDDENARIKGVLTECEAESCFDVYLDGEFWAEARLNQPGRHNVLNALGAIGIALEAGLPKEAILEGLAEFGGVGRRFERKGERGGVTVVDDYGHHPTEVAATLNTARQCYPSKRLVVAFQPHRFTRTQALFGDFCKAFSEADLLLLTEIYPASEAPIPGVSGQSLAQGIRQVSETPVLFFDDFDAMSAALPEVLRENDLLITLGAGNIWQVGTGWLKGN